MLLLLLLLLLLRLLLLYYYDYHYWLVLVRRVERLARGSARRNPIRILNPLFYFEKPAHGNRGAWLPSR